jgi:hypothetical protein
MISCFLCHFKGYLEYGFSSQEEYQAAAAQQQQLMMMMMSGGNFGMDVSEYYHTFWLNI